ncbi:MAG TPA: RNA-binding protein [Dysgonamonadaceae bacterium]|nr:RNA-binding protein [Dysgonamonadaceae bacterium]
MNIFIAGLTYQITEQDLRELFEEYGTVSSAKIITDNFTGRSRGFGFVEMEDDEAGHRAIDQLNDAEYDGRTITVDVAKPRKKRQRSMSNY